MNQSYNERRELVVFTACSVNYLEKAIAMFLSVEHSHPNVDMVVLLVDRKRPVSLLNSRVKLWWSEDIGFPDYLQCAFKYNIIELNTALKPYAALKLLDEYEKVIFLDPDTCLYNPLESTISALENNSSVFTPISLSPYYGLGRPSDIDLLRFGTNCLGFFAVKNSEKSREFLEWWHDQCFSKCFYEPQVGLAVDQKWVDLAPAFFEETYLLKDPGLNVAFWNLHERRISKTDRGWMVNDKYPLGFIHFSSFSINDSDVIANKQTRYSAGDRPDFTSAADIYREYLSTAKLIVNCDDIRYGYSTFTNGRAISPSLRRFYEVYKDTKFIDCRNPFAEDGSIYRFAKKYHLLSKDNFPEAHINFKVSNSYALQRKFIRLLFKMLLRILGPDRYFLFLRYMAYYSSIFNQSDMFDS